MRVKATLLASGKVRLEVGYYRSIILNDIEEIIQFSSDLNSDIQKMFNPSTKKPRKRTKKIRKTCSL